MTTLPARQSCNGAVELDSSDMKLRAARVVPITHERAIWPVRILRKLVSMAWGMFWRWRLGSFGTGSEIIAPAQVVGGRSISIDENVRIWRGARIEAINIGPEVTRIRIGPGTVIHPNVHIGAIDSVCIGRGVLMASNVYITDHDHDCSDPDDPVVSNRRALAARVEIGDYTWLGQGVMVLKGVRIGERSVIGAGSVVTKDVPAYSIAIGSPARVVKIFDHDNRTWKDIST